MRSCKHSAPVENDSVLPESDDIRSWDGNGGRYQPVVLTVQGSKMFPSNQATQSVVQSAFMDLRASARPVEISGLNTDESVSAATDRRQ